MVDAICTESYLNKSYLDEETVDTIYFGGGTPSLLTDDQLNQIFESLRKHFNISEDAEITLEANPDDLSREKLIALKKSPINRLSIGIQSFNDDHLRSINRAHSSTEAWESVVVAKEIGFTDITIDLIYGIPSNDHSIWESDVQKALTLKIPHLSTYCLTIETNTVFGRWTQKNKMKPLDEEFNALQFEYLVKQLKQAGYEHYEISNFALPNKYSQHNSSYWKGKNYLGLGPSAHSFNGVSRQFNVANNAHYLKSIAQGKIPADVELLDAKERANEMLLTGLRTIWGVNIDELNVILPEWSEINGHKVNELRQSGLLDIRASKMVLSEKGKLLADEITLKLFI